MDWTLQSMDAGEGLNPTQKLVNTKTLEQLDPTQENMGTYLIGDGAKYLGYINDGTGAWGKGSDYYIDSTGTLRGISGGTVYDTGGYAGLSMSHPDDAAVIQRGLSNTAWDQAQRYQRDLAHNSSWSGDPIGNTMKVGIPAVMAYMTGNVLGPALAADAGFGTSAALDGATAGEMTLGEGAYNATQYGLDGATAGELTLGGSQFVPSDPGAFPNLGPDVPSEVFPNLGPDIPPIDASSSFPPPVDAPPDLPEIPKPISSEPINNGYSPSAGPNQVSNPQTFGDELFDPNKTPAEMYKQFGVTPKFSIPGYGDVYGNVTPELLKDIWSTTKNISSVMTIAKTLGLTEDKVRKLLGLPDTSTTSTDKPKGDPARGALDVAQLLLLAGLTANGGKGGPAGGGKVVMGPSGKSTAMTGATSRAAQTTGMFGPKTKFAADGGAIEARPTGLGSLADFIKGAWGNDYSDRVGNAMFPRPAKKKPVYAPTAVAGEVNPQNRMQLEEAGMIPALRASGGKMTKAQFFGHLKGQTGGQDDKVPAMLSDGEYVMDAETVAHLGDGNNAAGAEKLDKMRESVRAHKRAGPLSKIAPKAKDPMQYLKGK